MMKHTDEFKVGQVATAKRMGEDEPRRPARITKIQKAAIFAVVDGVEVRFGLQRSGMIRDPKSGMFLQ